MAVEIDRSRIISYQRCPRERWLAYHACGKGLQRKAKALPLQVGSAFHSGAEHLLHNDISGAVEAATKFLAEAFAEKGVGFDGESTTDASILYSAQEQMALAEALIRGWGLEQLPAFLETFEVLEVEREGRADLVRACGQLAPSPQNHPAGVRAQAEGADSTSGSSCPDSIVLMFRPDALVRDRLSGDLYVVSWKTTSMYGKRTLQQCRTDMQSMLEVWGIGERTNDKNQEEGFVDAHPIEGTLYLFAVKGKRQLDDYDQQWKQQTHLIYGWKKLKPQDEFDAGWSWTFRYPKEDGSGHSTLGKGWQRVPIWSDYPGGVKAWIEALHAREVFPRHLDPFESVFPQSLPVERRVDEVERWKRQVTAQELRIANDLMELDRQSEDNAPEALDVLFPQHTGACFQFSGCQFVPICHEGIAAEPGELYQIRSANHPESPEEEE